MTSAFALPARAQQPASAALAASLGPDDRDALGRIAYAEAGNQHAEGLAAVVHAVLNRVGAGRFGAGVQGVLDAPGQFEPVMRAGGSWRNLPPLTEAQRLVFGTVLELIAQGRLPDLTAGSTYFQNPAIVAQRAAQGQVSPSLVDFGGQAPAAVVRDHSFYRDAPPGSAGHARHVGAVPPNMPAGQAEASPRAAFYRVVGGRLVLDGPASTGPGAHFMRVHAATATARVVRGAPPAS